MSDQPYHDEWGNEHAGARRCELCGASIVDERPDPVDESPADVLRFVLYGMQSDPVGMYCLLSRIMEPEKPLDELANQLACILRQMPQHYTKQAVEQRLERLAATYPGLAHELRPLASKGKPRKHRRGRR